jgi:mannose-6-phosphate isomerase
MALLVPNLRPLMSLPEITQPLSFEPIFMERVWGGRRLEALYGKPLPPGMAIGESWEIVDRPEAQSVVRNGPLRGQSIGKLWTEHQREVFGELPDTPRFPLLVKLLDARDRLSFQVHPPAEIAHELGGEAKTEFWYVADAAPASELYVGLRNDSARAEFEKALREGDVADHVHRIAVKTGDAMFLPGGRPHAIGAGNLIVEIQQNSDTTYRIYDWNRSGPEDRSRKLHIEESLRCINFEERQPPLTKAEGELLVRHAHFEVQKWQLQDERTVGPLGMFAIVFCLSGALECAGFPVRPGEFILVPSTLRDRVLKPRADGTALLHIAIPSSL